MRLISLLPRKKRSIVLAGVVLLCATLATAVAIGQEADEFYLSLSPSTPQRYGNEVTVTSHFPECDWGEGYDSSYKVTFTVVGANPQTETVPVQDIGFGRGEAVFTYEGSAPGIDEIVAVISAVALPEKCGVELGYSDAATYEWTGVGAEVFDLNGQLVSEGSVIGQLTPTADGGCDGEVGVEVLSGYYFDADVIYGFDDACRVIIEQILPQSVEETIEADNRGPDGNSVPPTESLEP